MKIKMRITNFSSFIRAVGQCQKPLYWIDESGSKSLLTATSSDLLYRKYVQQNQFLSLWLHFEDTSDYFKLLSCSAWDY